MTQRGKCSDSKFAQTKVASRLTPDIRFPILGACSGPTPSAVGQIQGTPTIKAFVPKRASARNAKDVVDYDQAREVSDLMRFATGRMPNYVESLSTAAALSAFAAKAKEWGLPRVLVFSNKAGQTSSTLKSLSAEYRRRVLIGEVRAQHLPEAAKAHGVSSFPTLLCFSAEAAASSAAPATAPSHRFEGKEPTFRRLDTFVGSKCALRKPVLRKPSSERAGGGGAGGGGAASGKEEL